MFSPENLDEIMKKENKESPIDSVPFPLDFESSDAQISLAEEDFGWFRNLCLKVKGNTSPRPEFGRTLLALFVFSQNLGWQADLLDFQDCCQSFFRWIVLLRCCILFTHDSRRSNSRVLGQREISRNISYELVNTSASSLRICSNTHFWVL